MAVWAGVHGPHGALAGTTIKDLSQVRKVNSAPLGLGNGNWSGEIHSFIYADGPPTIGVTALQRRTGLRSLTKTGTRLPAPAFSKCSGWHSETPRERGCFRFPNVSQRTLYGTRPERRLCALPVLLRMRLSAAATFSNCICSAHCRRLRNSCSAVMSARSISFWRGMAENDSGKLRGRLVRVRVGTVKAPNASDFLLAAARLCNIVI